MMPPLRKDTEKGGRGDTEISPRFRVPASPPEERHGDTETGRHGDLPASPRLPFSPSFLLSPSPRRFSILTHGELP